MKQKFFSPINPVEKKIAIVTIPTAGHIKILIQLVEEVTSRHSNLKFQFILTSWTGHPIREEDLRALEAVSGRKPKILESEKTVHCKENTFGRTRELVETVIQECSGVDLIIYDFMTPEGYIASKVLDIPRICSEPSYIGEFDISSEEFKKQVSLSYDDIESIEKKYDLKLVDQLKLISGTLSFICSTNLVFTWEKLLNAGEFKKNEEQDKNTYHCIRPTARKPPQLEEPFATIFSLGKKVVYFSLGTIACGVVWEETGKVEGNSLQDFIKLLYATLITTFTQREDLILIISTGRPSKDIIGNMALPENIYVYEAVPQADLLYHVDLFITHCGANGVNEAIDSETPMLGIPLMFDQPSCAEAIVELGIGDAFLLPPEEREASVNFFSNLYFRDPLYPNNHEKAQIIMEETIDKLLAADFSAAFLHLKSDKTLFFNDFYPFLNLDKQPSPPQESLLSSLQGKGM